MPELPTPKAVEAVTYSRDQIKDMILSGGNLGKLSLEQRADYVANLCQELGLNPMLKPFDFIPDGRGGLVLYANKSCSTQLRDKHGISIRKTYSGPLMIDSAPVTEIYTVEVEAAIGDRVQAEIGVSYIGGLKGADLANKIMHTYTKAVRRATLAIKGIGIPDEEELRDTPAFASAFEKQAKEPRKLVGVGDNPGAYDLNQVAKRLDKKEGKAEVLADPVLIGE